MPYIESKILAEKFDALSKLYQTIQVETKERQYEYNESMSEKENAEAEKLFKISEK